MRSKTLFAIMIACVVAVSGLSAQVRGTSYRVTAPSEAPTGEREITHYRVYGEGVTAEFVNLDTSTCDSGVRTIVTVHAGQGVIYVNGEPHDSNITSVVVTVFDQCSNTQLLSVTGTGPADELRLNPNRKSASLRTSIEGRDLFGNAVPITVDLVWNGAGQPDRTHDHVTYNLGVQLYVSTSNGMIRDAVAGGTVMVGTLDVTPLPSIYGVIETDSTRALSFYR